MSNDGSPSPETDLRARLVLLQAASEGKLDGLPCPRCQHPCVSVWFTHPAEDLYRTWFVCSQCGFEMRAQNASRPAHYSAERDRTARTPAPEPA